jgi:4-amino-4-deoxy-L-arabinose transferase-like glycosyltransferase
LIHQTPLGSTLLGALLFLALVIGFYVIRPAEDRRAVMLIAVACYLLKAALVPIYFWALMRTGLEGFAYLDAAGYHFWAQDMAVEITHGMPREHQGWTFASRGYFIICAYLYAWFGPNTLVPRFFNAAISSCALLYLFRLGKEFFDVRIARLATLMMAFLPFTILIVLNQRKDPLAQFLALFAFYHGMVLLRLDRRWPKSLLLVAVGLIGIYQVRSGFIPAFLAVMLISFLLVRRNIATAMAAAIPAVLAVVGLQILTPEESDIHYTHTVERLRTTQASAEEEFETHSGLLRYAHVTSPFQIYKIPLAGALLLVTPFPPRLNPPHLPAFLFDWANMVNLILLPRMVIGVLAVLREPRWREKFPLLLYPAFFLMLLGPLRPSITRYRETVFSVLLLLAAVGFQHPRNRAISAVIYAGLAAFGAFVMAVRISR